MSKRSIYDFLRESFGDPIGSYAGDAPVGVRSECAGCGMPSEQCSCPSSAVCPMCGMMPVGGECECGTFVHEASSEPCSECGMLEIDGVCECGTMKESKLHEVAPEGYEKIVKALKKNPSIDNPWAIAWSMKKKGIKPKKGKKKKG